MSGKNRKGKWNTRSRNNDSEREGLAGGEVPAGRYGELFLEYKRELTASQDKHERIVKLSRDCTIHSKRAIFTLHLFSGDLETKAKVLEEADAKFRNDIVPILYSLCEEIGTEDPYRHHRAYSQGVQEFIEALAYYEYLKSGRLISYKAAQDFMTFRKKSKKTSAEEEEEEEEEEKSDLPKFASSLEASADEAKCVLYLTPSDFLLGLADLTGELMRLCINSVGSGNRKLPFELLPFFRALFCGFHSFGSGVKYMNPKRSVLRSSLGKVENVCYTLKVRGSEIPKQMLMDVINTAQTEPCEN